MVFYHSMWIVRGFYLQIPKFHIDRVKFKISANMILSTNTMHKTVDTAIINWRWYHSRNVLQKPSHIIGQSTNKLYWNYRLTELKSSSFPLNSPFKHLQRLGDPCLSLPKRSKASISQETQDWPWIDYVRCIQWRTQVALESRGM